MSETYESMMREVSRWAYNKPNAGDGERLQAALAFICNEIDNIKGELPYKPSYMHNVPGDHKP